MFPESSWELFKSSTTELYQAQVLYYRFLPSKTVSTFIKSAAYKRQSWADQLAIDASKKEGIKRVIGPSPGIPAINMHFDLTPDVLRAFGGGKVYKLVMVK